MKNLMYIFVFLFTIKAISQQQKTSIKQQKVSFKNPFGNEFWEGQDKTKHVAGTFAISTATYTFLSLHPKYKNYSVFKKRLISFASSMAAGLLKETFDGVRRDNFFCQNDMVANLIGSLGFQATLTIPLNLKKKDRPPMFVLK